MTGHGHGSYANDGMSLTVEIRTVNSRYAKVNVRCGETYQSLEPQIEELVRKRIRRGAVQVNVRVEKKMVSDRFSVNEEILGQYLSTIQRLNTQQSAISIESLLGLPGVIEESTDNRLRVETDWPVIETLLLEALDRLNEMRKAEGQSMEEDLLKNCSLVESQLGEVELYSPKVAEQYQHRLVEKLNGLLRESGVEISGSEVIKEVGIFADRSDISEEIVRLRTHLQQFRKVILDSGSQGRKLDFLTQEMFRETNTIGSKANDAEIAQRVVEMKTAIERIREMVQNIE
ncbi:MAG: YicC/YloC family endoribonuclease [Planctomycetota bacterium]|nr:YicC/YloC family endoribonuclease [Planctomycetota bacterium]